MSNRNKTCGPASLVVSAEIVDAVLKRKALHIPQNAPFWKKKHYYRMSFYQF